MKRVCRVICFLTVLLTVWLTVITSWQKSDVYDLQKIQQNTEFSFQIPNQQQHHEATLTDAAQIYRICSSRPQRILPSQEFRHDRVWASFYGSSRRHIINLLYSFHDSRWRLKSSPFCLHVSCDYYVIALRHIIR